MIPAGGNVLYIRIVLKQVRSMVSDILSAPRISPEVPKLLDRVRERLRVRHYSLRTETAYFGWIRRYIHFHGKRHPAGMGKVEVEAFLTSPAMAGNVGASTQNQALSTGLRVASMSAWEWTASRPAIAVRLAGAAGGR
jgi:hypothetical protein